LIIIANPIIADTVVPQTKDGHCLSRRQFKKELSAIM
jgi:hypothetical protein